MKNHEEWAKTVEWVGIAAGCVIKKDGRYLLVQEKQPKVYGLWNIPAGYVDKGEDIESAAIREAKEEVGLTVKLGDKVGVYHDSTNQPVRHAFRADIIGGELKIQEEEILDAKWLTYEEVKQLNEAGKIRSPWIFEAISTVETE